MKCKDNSKIKIGSNLVCFSIHCLYLPISIGSDLEVIKSKICSSSPSRNAYISIFIGLGVIKKIGSNFVKTLGVIGSDFLKCWEFICE